MDHALGGSQTLYGTRGTIIDETGQTLAGSVLEYDCQLDPLLITQIDQDIANGKNVDGRARGRRSPPRSPSSPGRPLEEVQAIVGDALADDPDSRFAMLKRGLSTEAYRDLADARRARTSSACSIPPARIPTAPSPATSSDSWAPTAMPLEGLEMTEDSCLAADERQRRLPEGQGRGRHPRHQARAAGDRRRHAASSRSTATCSGTCSSSSASRRRTWAPRPARSWSSRSPPARSAPRRSSRASTPTTSTRRMPTDRGSRIFRELVRAGLDVQGADGGDRHRRGRADAAVDRRRVERRDVPQRRAGAGLRSTTPPTRTRSPACSSTRRTRASRSSASGSSAQTRYDYLKKFGIGQGSAVGFPGEANGRHPPRRRVGQPDRSTTPRTGRASRRPCRSSPGAYAAIANDGVRMPLSLVESCTEADGTVVDARAARARRRS